MSHLFSFLSFFHPFLSLSFLQTCSLPHKYVRTKHPQGGCGLRGGTEGGCGCKGTLSACVRVLTLCLVVQIGAYRTHTFTHTLSHPIPTRNTHTHNTHIHIHTLEDIHTHTTTSHHPLPLVFIVDIKHLCQADSSFTTPADHSGFRLQLVRPHCNCYRGRFWRSK